MSWASVLGAPRQHPDQAAQLEQEAGEVASRPRVGGVRQQSLGLLPAAEVKQRLGQVLCQIDAERAALEAGAARQLQSAPGGLGRLLVAVDHVELVRLVEQRAHRRREVAVGLCQLAALPYEDQALLAVSGVRARDAERDARIRLLLPRTRTLRRGHGELGDGRRVVVAPVQVAPDGE
jgi:hypothetical protein